MAPTVYPLHAITVPASALDEEDSDVVKIVNKRRPGWADGYKVSWGKNMGARKQVGNYAGIVAAFCGTTLSSAWPQVLQTG